jgi:hypothetical protein
VFCTVYRMMNLGTKLTVEASAPTAMDGRLIVGLFRKDWPGGVGKAYLCRTAASREAPLRHMVNADVVRVWEIIRGPEETPQGRWVKQEWRCMPKAAPFVIAGFDPLDDDQEDPPTPGQDAAPAGPTHAKDLDTASLGVI